MAWEFLYSIRREFHGESNWGEMYMKSTDNKKWEWLCYTYELPWKANAAGKSLNKFSRVEMGVYELNQRTDGPLREAGGKDWTPRQHSDPSGRKEFVYRGLYLASAF